MKKRSSFKVKSCKQTKSYLWSSNILTYKQKYKIATIVKLQKRKKRQKIFIKKLNAKRKLAFLYGRLSKKTIKSLKKQAMKIKTNSTTGVGEKLLCLLERRLDSCLFRIDFFRSFSEARQYINHGHVLVNSKVVNLCSFMLKPGDIISIKYPTSLEEVNNVNSLSNLLFKYQTYKTINSKIKDLFKKKLFSPTPASRGRFLTIESRRRPQLLRNSNKGSEEVKKSKIYYRDSTLSSRPRGLTSPLGVGSSRAPQGRDSTLSSRARMPQGSIIALAPLERIVKRLRSQGICKIRNFSNRDVIPTRKTAWINLEITEIVQKYNEVWTGLLNYYSFAYNRSQLNFIQHLLHHSLACTLMNKLKINSRRQVFKKFGKEITVDKRKNGKPIKFNLIKSLKRINKFSSTPANFF